MEKKNRKTDNIRTAKKEKIGKENGKYLNDSRSGQQQKLTKEDTDQPKNILRGKNLHRAEGTWGGSRELPWWD